jgi:hypothetical protein
VPARLQRGHIRTFGSPAKETCRAA